MNTFFNKKTIFIYIGGGIVYYQNRKHFYALNIDKNIKRKKVLREYLDSFDTRKNELKQSIKDCENDKKCDYKTYYEYSTIYVSYIYIYIY